MSVFSKKSKNFKIIAGATAVLIVIALIAVGFFAYYAVKASASEIYSGVKVGTVDVGGMDEKSAEKLIRQKYKADDTKFTLNCEGTVFDVYASAISFDIDYKACAKNAAQYGKKGSVFKKISSMRTVAKNGKTVNLVISCDEGALQNIINEKMGDRLEPVEEYSVEIGENELIVSNGKSGKCILADTVAEQMRKSFEKGKTDETINVAIEDVNPQKIDFDEFYKEYNREAQNARLEENGDEITIIPEVLGIKLDKEKTKSVLEKNNNSSEKYLVPAEITVPEITAKGLEEEYTDTLIGSYTTDYSTSTENRKENIRIASEKINGFILSPGEVFSFNNVVGPRTADRGYKIAAGYSGTSIVEDLGGGICQVSSTLYNAVVFADLEIVYRTNHTMPVSYTPLGRDATVSYGAVDFKFKNNKPTPIKFEVIANGSTLTVNVYGRKKYIKDITIESEITGYTPFSVKEIKDDTMYTDETKTETEGVNGTSVKTYKVVKENGQVISRNKLSSSNYAPVTKVVRVGTKPREPLPDVTPENTDSAPADPYAGVLPENAISSSGEIY